MFTNVYVLHSNIKKMLGLAQYLNFVVHLLYCSIFFLVQLIPLNFCYS